MPFRTFNTTSSELTDINIPRLGDKIEAFGKVFLTMATTKNGIMYDWVQLLGSPSEAEEFIFNVEYQGPKCTHAFFGEVASGVAAPTDGSLTC